MWRKLLFVGALQLTAIAALGQVPLPETSYYPLFQFQVFYYSNDLEFAPSYSTSFSGPVQANANIYFEPPGSIDVSGDIMASGEVIAGEDPLDPTERSIGTVTFPVTPETNVFPYLMSWLPSGTSVSAMLQVPPPGSQDISYFYNYTDMIIIVSNNDAISVTSGIDINGATTVIPSNQWQVFLNTNGSFYDQRDALTVNPVVINVSNLVNWSATNTVLRPVLANARASFLADVQSIYVADFRSLVSEVITYQTNGIHHTVTATTNYVTNCQPGIVLSNGQVLTPQGLSIATPDPVYVIGNWNVQTSFNGASDAGKSSTSDSVLSAVYADAVTVLSSAWNPSNSTLGLGSRGADSDTVNAALFTGNVPSNGTNYSGGLENFIRLLENWNGQTLTYNGSMCCMFTSQIAKEPWPGTGNVYNPPVRNWNFDTNLSNPIEQPDLTPTVEQLATTGTSMSITKSNGFPCINWATHPMASYTLQYATSLHPANWQSLAAFVSSTNYTNFIDTASDGQRFYRLNIVP